MLAKIEIDRDGDVYFWNEKNQCHRTDGGPAVEYADGSKGWFVNDKRHRLDGPAIEYADGSIQWWINGKEYTEEEFNKLVGGLC